MDLSGPRQIAKQKITPPSESLSECDDLEYVVSSPVCPSFLEDLESTREFNQAFTCVSLVR